MTADRIDQLDDEIMKIEAGVEGSRRAVAEANEKIDALHALLKEEIESRVSADPFSEMVAGTVPIHRMDPRVSQALFDRRGPIDRWSPDGRSGAPIGQTMMQAVQRSHDRPRALAAVILNGFVRPGGLLFSIVPQSSRSSRHTEHGLWALGLSELLYSERIREGASAREEFDSLIEALIPVSMRPEELRSAANVLYSEARVRLSSDPLSRKSLVEIDSGGKWASVDRLQEVSEIEDYLAGMQGKGVPEDFYLSLSAGRIVKHLQSVARYDWERAGRSPDIFDVFREEHSLGLGDPRRHVTEIEDSTRNARPGSNAKRARQKEDLESRFGTKCNVCRIFDGAVIDHDHPSDLVRGLLCHACNKKATVVCAHSGINLIGGEKCAMGDYLDSPPAFSIEMRDPFYGGGRTFMKSLDGRLDDMEAAAKSAPDLGYILPMLEKLRRGELLSADETLYSPLRD